MRNHLLSFIHFFPKYFKGKNHQERLEEISISICKTLTTSTLNNFPLSNEDIGIIFNLIKKDLKIILEQRKENLEKRLKETTNFVNSI